MTACKEEARRAATAAKIAEYAERVAAEAPPLTFDQRNRLAVLLRLSKAENTVENIRVSERDEAAAALREALRD